MRSESTAVATEQLAARPLAPNDDDLVDRAVAGESQAFEQLVIRYQDRVYNLLLRQTGSSEDAEELAQETFLKAYRALGRFRRGSKFYTWLFRIAVNAGYSRGRKHALRQRIEGVSLDAPGFRNEPPWHDRLAGTCAEPGKEMEQRQLHERVHQGLAELDEEFRAVLLLRDMEGLGYRAIAEALSISHAAVRSRLHRARVKLARALKDLKPEKNWAGRLADA
jgi:RNA polymerase sigma-70 factor (ECF subfamily)